VYSEVLRHIQSDYVEDPNIGNVTNGALRGLLESLDAASSYLTPTDYKAYKADKAKGEGKAQVGINVSKRFGYATVVSVVPGSPADKAGLIDGDILEAINGTDTRDTSLAMIGMMLNGQPGSELSVGVVRPRKPVPDTLKMTRTIVIEPPVGETLYESSSILYLKPVILDKDHVATVEAKLKAQEKGSVKKVLLDLRDVAAGDMVEATRLANFFVKSGTIATLEGQKVEKVTYTADPAKAIAATSPMVVLVNRGTAGPGELVAAALLDSKRAQLVGEKTFGEGAQQKTFELPDGAALILSVAKYASPSGKKFQDDAVTPDILVAGNFEEPGGDDEDNDGASTTNVHAKPAVQVDDQLSKALDLLKAKTS
jgi:carboxyl-terminal processing protease